MNRVFPIAMFLCICTAASAIAAIGVSHLAYAEGQDAVPRLVDADGGVAAGAQDAAPYGELYVDAGAAIAAEQTPSTPSAPKLDPAGDPVGTGTLVYRLWKAGALIPAVLVSLFAALVIASRRLAWLAEGRRAVWTAAAIAGLAILAEPASRGETPNLAMVVAALSSMTALLIVPTVPPKRAGGAA